MQYIPQKMYRSSFVNMQWALGTKGSGAPVHFHNVAWSQLFYGRKHWYILPPRTTLMGNKQVLDWVENDMQDLEKQGFHMMQCTQQQVIYTLSYFTLTHYTHLTLSHFTSPHSPHLLTTPTLAHYTYPRLPHTSHT